MKKKIVVAALTMALMTSVSSAKEISVGLSFGESQGKEAEIHLEGGVISYKDIRVDLPSIRRISPISCDIEILTDKEYKDFSEAFIEAKNISFEKRNITIPVFSAGRIFLGQVKEGNSDFLCIRDSSNNSFLGYEKNEFVRFIPKQDYIRFRNNPYRGDFSFYIKDSNISVINHLDIEHYLYGVVPKEVSASWHMEALKAQSVAARNYAYSNIGKFSEHGFDICATQNCQVYGGKTSEHIRTNEAVDETKGDVLMHEGKRVIAFYHASSGGITANSENVWKNKVPYLRSVLDPYSIGNKHDEWEISFSKKDIEELLKKDNVDIGDIEDIVIRDVGTDKRVLRMEIMGKRGSKTYEREDIRRFFGYSVMKSTLFDLVKDEKASFPSDFQSISKLFTGELSLSDFTSKEAFVFRGSGWGHGIGMSQLGAKKMAETGSTYEQILRHYFKDSYLVKEKN